MNEFSWKINLFLVMALQWRWCS